LTLRVGIISDTHGLLRPEASAFLRGCEHIVHAGDVGGPHVLQELALIAPLTVVRGNNDKGSWAEELPDSVRVRFEKVALYLIHDLAQLEIDPGADGVRVIVSGHSHQPRMWERDGVLYVNPGSAGPRRFRLPVAVAELSVTGTSVAARIQELNVQR
jgi:uncharacterized protein